MEDEEERADRARALAAVARSEANDAVVRQEQAILETSPMPPHKVLMRGDGNCLFRALSFATHGTQQRFHYYRTMAVMRVRNNPGDFEEFLDGDETLNAWADRLSRDMVFGDHLCLKALAEVVSRPIVVWRQRLLNTDLPQSAKVTVFVPDGYTNEEPIHVLLEETALAPQGAWCGFADYEGHYNVLQAAPAPARAPAASASPGARGAATGEDGLGFSSAAGLPGAEPGRLVVGEVAAATPALVVAVELAVGTGPAQRRAAPRRELLHT